LPRGKKQSYPQEFLINFDHLRANRSALLLGPFLHVGQALPQRWYQIDIFSYFNVLWDQPTHVLDIVGLEGTKLTGRLAHAVDPELDDSEFLVQAEFECPAPPLRVEAELSEAETEFAIQFLQQSFLTIGGKDEPSSMMVGDIVRRFVENGLLELEGWKAEVKAPGIVNVTYSLLDETTPVVAHWQVMPRPREIRCRNRAAKMMSWFPPKP
jgi:hypothetical protein